ncbi:formylglycine-generating enzyme-like isoform X2 [Hyposmocoma kahamanoa]|uniref:formylglycine-generating enzyme-like isoform X2 n=1 Tax=Hyposmocoma kahamanoa TaxID=1477025 RepID=UPI000E6D814D|nr:formylglycine-generating enzyme-like isoform X2 [Hyposmocoma kahamanoa]
MNLSFLFMFLIQSFIQEDCRCDRISRDRRSENVVNTNQDSHENNFSANSEDIQDMVRIPAGIYQVGTDNVIMASDKEGPKRLIAVSSFYLDKHEVSNEEFSRFVAATNYRTTAEVVGESDVFHIFLNTTFKEKLKKNRLLTHPWWYKVKGTNWRHPYGPDSTISDTMDHPVVHVSWRDARAFCAWRGARLPTEGEWEGACRAGHYDITYPWGNELFPGNRSMANNWQGSFPTYNSEKDGYIGTNPVWNFPPNEFGLYNMIGNAWEWTEDSWSESKQGEKVFKGGSFLCHHSYCFRYRCSARTRHTLDTSGVNKGFRCAKSLN